MKIFKKLLLGFVGVLAILFAVGLTQPSIIIIERSIVIDAPIEMVYDQVNNLHNWEKWSPWHKLDTAMGLTYQNGGIGKNASYTWTSDHKNVGNGKLTIADAKEYEYVNTIMDFGEKGTGTANFKFVSTASGVQVIWDMHSDIGKNPFMRLMGIMMRKGISAAYDRGLADIANQCDYLKETVWYAVKIKSKEGWKYYGIPSENVTLQTMPYIMDSSYTKIYGSLSKEKIEVNGPAFTVYFNWGQTFKMEYGVGVKDNSKSLLGLESKEIPTQTYAVLKHNGPYDGLSKAHEFMGIWLESAQMVVSGPVIEKYKVGPPTETDSQKWVTYLLYPIKDME